MFRSPLAAVAVACILVAGYLVLGSTGQIQAQNQGAAAETDKIHAGHEAFDRNCLQCHAVLDGQYSFGPNLAGETKKPGHKVTAAEIRTIIENGKGKMPPMKERVTSPEIDDLIAYIRTL